MSKEENEGKSEEALHEREKKEYAKPLIKKAYGYTQELSMQTMSRTIKRAFIFLGMSCTFSASARDDMLSIPFGKVKVSITKENNQIVARENNRRLQVSTEVSQHLALAYDARIISKTIYKNKPLFIVLSREPSRQNAMGQGYCGAGYEEHLLLIEISQSKIALRDKLLLQSCLKSISMVVDRGDDRDDAGNGLIENSDGSFDYRLLIDEDNQIRNLAWSRGRFKISFRPSVDRASDTAGQ